MQLTSLPSFPKDLFSRKAALPLAFAGLGVSYFALTALRRPPAADVLATQLWERHERDAKFALLAGLSAGVVLWWTR
jgi:hypothetical protein